MAAALPGMDSTENKPPEDSILFRCILHVLYTTVFYRIYTSLQFFVLNNYLSVFFVYDFSLIIFLVQEVVLKDTPNEVKDPDGGCAC